MQEIRELLRDDQWKRLEPLLPGKAGDRGATGRDNRLFLEAVLWIVRAGAPWRDLPAALGNWHTTYTRFKRWGESGVWQRIVEAVNGDRDLEALMLDSTAVRAHHRDSVMIRTGSFILKQWGYGLGMLRKWAITAAGISVLGILVWTSDFITLQGERTIYTAGCQDGVWKGDQCTGKLVAAERYKFRALKAHNEVIFWTVGSAAPSGKFAHCVVTNGRYWSCEANGEASAAITLEMRHGKPVTHPGENTRPFHQISKFRWVLLQYGISVSNTVSSS